MSEEEEQLFGIDKLNIKRSEIPSTAKQTVHKETNKKYHDLINKFYEKKIVQF